MIVTTMQYAYDTAKSAVATGIMFPVAANKAEDQTASASAMVTISDAAKQLNLNEQLQLPNPENIRKLSAALTDNLNSLLASAGIKTEPAVSFEIDVNSAHVTVKGNRPDILTIEALVNADKSVQRQMHDVAALSSHAVAMAASMQFNTEYAAAGRKAEIDTVLAKYAGLLGGQQRFAAITLGFDGSGIQVNADGKPWLPTASPQPSA